MNKYHKFSIFLLFFAAIGVIFVKSNRVNLTPTAPQSRETLQAARLILNIDGQEQSVDASAFINKSALEASQSLTKIETTGTGEGAFVTSVNGRTADTSRREFWELLINGTSAQVGAGSYIIKSGDTIEWKLNTY